MHRARLISRTALFPSRSTPRAFRRLNRAVLDEFDSYDQPPTFVGSGISSASAVLVFTHVVLCIGMLARIGFDNFVEEPHILIGPLVLSVLLQFVMFILVKSIENGLLCPRAAFATALCASVHCIAFNHLLSVRSIRTTDAKYLMASDLVLLTPLVLMHTVLQLALPTLWRMFDLTATWSLSGPTFIYSSYLTPLLASISTIVIDATIPHSTAIILLPLSVSCTATLILFDTQESAWNRYAVPFVIAISSTLPLNSMPLWPLLMLLIPIQTTAICLQRFESAMAISIIMFTCNLCAVHHASLE